MSKTHPIEIAEQVYKYTKSIFGFVTGPEEQNPHKGHGIPAF